MVAGIPTRSRPTSVSSTSTRTQARSVVAILEEGFSLGDAHPRPQRLRALLVGGHGERVGARDEMHRAADGSQDPQVGQPSFPHGQLRPRIDERSPMFLQALLRDRLVSQIELGLGHRLVPGGQAGVHGDLLLGQATAGVLGLLSLRPDVVPGNGFRLIQRFIVGEFSFGPRQSGLRFLQLERAIRLETLQVLLCGGEGHALPLPVQAAGLGIFPQQLLGLHHEDALRVYVPPQVGIVEHAQELPLLHHTAVPDEKRGDGRGELRAATGRLS